MKKRSIQKCPQNSVKGDDREKKHSRFLKKTFFLREHWANFNQTWHIGYSGERNIKFVVIKWNCENTLTTINVFPSITRGVFFATWKRKERSFIPFLWSWKIVWRPFHSYPEEGRLDGRVTWFKLLTSTARFCAANVVLRQKVPTWIYLWDINVIMVRFMFWKYTPIFYLKQRRLFIIVYPWLE